MYAIPNWSCPGVVGADPDLADVRADQSAEGGTVQVVRVDVKPGALVLADQVPVEEKSLQQVHQGILRQVSLRVLPGLGYGEAQRRFRHPPSCGPRRRSVTGPASHPSEA